MSELDDLDFPKEFILEKEEELLQNCKSLLRVFFEYVKEHRGSIYTRSSNKSISDVSKVFYKKRIIRLGISSYYNKQGFVSFHGSKEFPESTKVAFNLVLDNLYIHIPYYYLPYETGFRGFILDRMIHSYSLDSEKKINDFINVFSLKRLELI